MLIDLARPTSGDLLGHDGFAGETGGDHRHRGGLPGCRRLCARDPASGVSKVICVGLNYRAHILEMGRDLPGVPHTVRKFTDALIGAPCDIMQSRRSPGNSDWEAELAVIVGTTRAARTGKPPPAQAIAGSPCERHHLPGLAVPTRSGCRAKPGIPAPRLARTW